MEEKECIATVCGARAESEVGKIHEATYSSFVRLKQRSGCRRFAIGL